MADKATQKELKQPDTFQRVGAQARDWLVDRQRTVSLLAAGVLAVGLVAGLANRFAQKGKQKEAAVFGDTLNTANKPVGAQGADTTFKTEREKDEALRAALTDYQQKGVDDARIRRTATFALAHAELRLRNADAALQQFDAYLKDASKDDPLYWSAVEGRGYALEAKGQLDEALAAFDRLSQENQTEFLQGMGLYHHGRILVAQNKKEEAAKVFTEVSSKFPETGAAKLASERVALLAAEGITPPPPPPVSAAPDAK